MTPETIRVRRSKSSKSSSLATVNFSSPWPMLLSGISTFNELLHMLKKRS